MTATEKKPQRGESRRRSATRSPVVRPRGPLASISAVSSPDCGVVPGSVRSGTRNYRPADGGLASRTADHAPPAVERDRDGGEPAAGVCCRTASVDAGSQLWWVGG